MIIVKFYNIIPNFITYDCKVILILPQGSPNSIEFSLSMVIGFLFFYFDILL